ncbi:hypothetical protein ACVWXN_007030 [Bradyrhizobium sp. i1.4.4]
MKPFKSPERKKQLDGDDGTERVAVIGIAVQGLGKHELPPLGAVAGVAIETLESNS